MHKYPVDIIELSTIFENLQPDVVLTVADRYETLATAVAASYMNIPLAHTQGGEVTGSIDESVRHAITKLSNIHFPATKLAKRNIIKMGENPKNVYIVVAKFEDDILSEGQKLPMEVEGNYHIRDLYFEESGTYVYSIEIDTGHGTLKSYEQNIIVSEKQTEVVAEEDGGALTGLSMAPIIFIIIIIATRKR